MVDSRGQGGNARRTRWGLVLLCAMGCATGEQNGGQNDASLFGRSGAGSDGTAGSVGNSGATSSLGGGGSPGSSGAFTAGGTFTAAGTFTAGGTFTSAGTFSSAGMTSSSAGTGGVSSGGMAGAAAGGKGGTGSAGAAAAGASSGGSGGGNCATGKLATPDATASSQERGDLSAKAATDGNTTDTRWGSDHSEPQWLQLDFGEVVHVSRVVIVWEPAYATKYELQIAKDAAGPFTTIYTNASGKGGTEDITAGLTPSSGRYLRMNGLTRSTVYGFSIYEMTAYGDTNEACQ